MRDPVRKTLTKPFLGKESSAIFQSVNKLETRPHGIYGIDEAMLEADLADDVAIQICRDFGCFLRPRDPQHARLGEVRFPCLERGF